MRRVLLEGALAAVCLLAFLPAAHAQGAIGGTVRDASGGVLPGVTVEAASPALIERVRTAVTDDRGQYLIIDLRPGAYAVTFTLPGFTSVRREGLMVTAGTTLPINAELSVGEIQETVTVTGETPVVDVQNIRQQVVVQRDLLDAIPRARGQQVTGALLPGMVITGAGANDVGGSGGLSGTAQMSIHGSDAADQNWAIDGMKVGEGGRGAMRQAIVADAAVQEYTFETSALSAENASGGVKMNLIPREGGNRFTGTTFFSLTTKGMISDNLSDSLKSRGLTTVDSVDKIWDVSPALGGPVVPDRLWFFATYRHQGKDTLPTDAFFESDPTRQAVDIGRYASLNLRLTSQVTPRNKLSLYYDRQHRHMPYWQTNATRTPEASTNLQYPNLYIAQGRWTSPLTNRLLFEAGSTFFVENQRFYYSAANQPGTFPHVEITTGKITQKSTGASTSCAGIGCVGDHNFLTSMASLSYVTGSHNFKVGMSHMSGCHCKNFDPLPPIVRTSNGVPIQLQLVATPRSDRAHLKYDVGVFAQDQWTVRNFTVNLGIRFDAMNQFLEEQDLPAGQFVPARHLDKITNVPNWKDISPRLGVAWNVFGNGRTAVKASASRYLYADQTAFATSVNPLNSTLTLNDTRTIVSTNGSSNPLDWTLGPSTNLNFGRAALSVRPDPSVSEGWGARGYNWEYTVSVQQELGPGIAVNAGYYRRQFGNLTWTNNLLVTPADFTPIRISNPIDGSPLTIYNLNAAKRGVSDNVIQFAPENGQVFDGIDVTMSARFGAGAVLTGGVSTGRTTRNTCTAWDPNQTLFCDVVPAFMAQNQYKFMGTYPLPYAFQISGTFVSIPGPNVAANYTVTSAIAGTTLTNGTITVPLISPNTYGERQYRTDLRVARNFRPGAHRLQLYLDVFNAFNASPVTGLNTTFGSTWQRPTATLIGRMLQFGVQANFGG